MEKRDRAYAWAVRRARAGTPSHGGRAGTLPARSAGIDWRAIEDSLRERPYARTPPLLTPSECDELIALYRDDSRFRSRVDMARLRFGVGDYKNFALPRPPPVLDLRTHAYPPLASIANRWMEALGSAERFPA